MGDVIVKKGDIVGRISYNQDIIFVIYDIKGNTAFLQGLYVRLIADSDLSDLVLIENSVLTRYQESKKEYENSIISNYKKKIDHITGRILHIDSDAFYLKKCLNLYESLGIYAYGVEMDEDIMPANIMEYMLKVRPNVVVITGHDSYNNRGVDNLNNYKNTLNFVKTIVKIRTTYGPSDVFIFAGACGSNAEALIAAGANFSSSFDRKNIEAYDPAIVGILAAITPFNQIIKIDDIYSFSKMKRGSIGGVESHGKMRLLVR